MNLNTVYSLSYGDEDQVILQEDDIKVSLSNGEVLIGEYVESDCDTLTISRKNCEEVLIAFDDVECLEKIGG